ncbi:hypothetical protein Pfo_015317 [Paulownia fortunei]|nr:hypothetical protein Pfo_015317 [Paulownia fortunei]
MICSRHIAFSLVTLYGIAIFAILRKRYLLRAVADPENKDIISQLPDDILISIITRTPTKDAVRTSILSKRWRNLYKFVSTINFRCQYLVGPLAFTPHDSKVIIDGVDRYLRLHSGSKIRSFDFHCCLTQSNSGKFKQCIFSLGKSGIEKLILQFCCKLQCSDLLFSCQLLSHMPSLEYFELILCSLQPNLKSQCNSLKTLRLTRVTALPGSLECILSNCLSLQSLTIDYCKFPSKLCIRGPSLQLKSLVIQVCEGVEEIEFYASNLIIFEFLNPEMVNFIFDYVPQLQSIYLSLFDKNVMSYVCERLAKDLPHLNSLTFDTQGDFYQESSRPTGINLFNNLKRLELSLCCTHETNLLSLTPFLHSCPLLQEFHLATTLSEYNGPQVKKQVLLQSQLKNVEISGFGGTKNEIDFALYILKCAVSLEQMYISRLAKYYIGFSRWMVQGRPPWSEQKHKMIRKQLQEQALSRTVQVIIQHGSRL